MSTVSSGFLEGREGDGGAATVGGISVLEMLVGAGLVCVVLVGAGLVCAGVVGTGAGNADLTCSTVAIGAFEPSVVGR